MLMRSVYHRATFAQLHRDPLPLKFLCVQCLQFIPIFLPQFPYMKAAGSGASHLPHRDKKIISGLQAFYKILFLKKLFL